MARKDRLIQEYVHDPYFAKAKPSEPAVCERCGVVFQGGLFTWAQSVSPAAESIVCPACRRIADNYEGGIVHLQGEFLDEHREEIIKTIRNVEKESTKTRPLERIISISREGDSMVVTTTYEHLAKKIGNALRRAFKGDLKTQFLEGEKYVRVWWNR
jgi:NMD protein affecting ribosome stability and mRNA decay